MMLLALFAGPIPGPRSTAGAVAVTVTGIRASQHGTLLVALYRGASSWLTLDSAVAVRRLPVTTDSVVVLFDEVSPDTGYAIAVIHDRNDNDRMDMRWFPWPKPREGAGVSGNHVRMGKPEFSRARFAVGGGQVGLTIRMRY